MKMTRVVLEHRDNHTVVRPGSACVGCPTVLQYEPRTLTNTNWPVALGLTLFFLVPLLALAWIGAR